jgi:FKBP-type peptidyl-prolyl cis-trans isomerase
VVNSGTTLRAGLRLEEETEGTGPAVARGDTVTVAYELQLNRGDVVQVMQQYRFTVGRRQVIAALEYGVEGMRVGGRRRFRAGPHLAYGEAGVEGSIPPDAVLVFDVTLLGIESAGS